MTDRIRKLRNKIWLTLFMSASSFIILILAIIYSLMNNSTQRMIYRSLTMRANSVELYFEDIFFTAVVRETGVENIHTSSHLPSSTLEMLVSQALPLIDEHYYYQIRVDEQVWAYIIRDTYHITSLETETDYTRILFVNVTELTSKLERLLFSLIVIGGTSLVVICIGSLFFANLLIKPTIRAFSKEKEVNAWQKRFIANASHELRTPLTLLKSGYDEILDHPEETITSQKKWFNVMSFGIERMENLTTELLVLSKLEYTKNEIVKNEMVNLNQLINEIIMLLEMKMLEKGIIFLTGEKLDITIKQNEEKLRQVILILLDNAIKYVNDQGWIKVEINQQDEQIELVVKNSGSGISANDLPHIFERFYRGNDVSGKSKGYGLGLAIAKETIELLGGIIFAESEIDEVTSFGFILPIE